eukprot:3436640-Pyramimonas_sp.AAC.1
MVPGGFQYGPKEPCRASLSKALKSPLGGPPILSWPLLGLPRGPGDSRGSGSRSSSGTRNSISKSSRSSGSGSCCGSIRRSSRSSSRSRSGSSSSN